MIVQKERKTSSSNDAATLDDLNNEYIKEYLDATNAKRDLLKRSKEDMAKSMGLVAESGTGSYRTKIFAVLMFADRPGAFI